jgi:predicted lysophospholipase L1 biosynthesis ABC-type transport system permease subunit
MLQHFMGFIEKLLVETMKIAQIMLVQLLSMMVGHHLGNAFALAHPVSLKSKVQSPKSKVIDDVYDFGHWA